MPLTEVVKRIEAPAGVAYYKQAVASFLRDNKGIHLIVLLINQIFRAVMMAATIVTMPFTPMANLAMCFGMAAFYWITVERNCAFQFALPSFFGGAAYELSKPALPALVYGTAFRSFQALAVTLSCAWPLCLYSLAVTVIVHRDVERWTRAQGKR